MRNHRVTTLVVFVIVVASLVVYMSTQRVYRLLESNQELLQTREVVECVKLRIPDLGDATFLQYDSQYDDSLISGVHLTSYWLVYQITAKGVVWGNMEKGPDGEFRRAKPVEISFSDLCRKPGLFHLIAKPGKSDSAHWKEEMEQWFRK